MTGRHRRSEGPVDGIGRWGRPSRHRPPGSTATADTAQGARVRRYLPGPPGDVHTSRMSTDTWDLSAQSRS